MLSDSLTLHIKANFNNTPKSNWNAVTKESNQRGGCRTCPVVLGKQHPRLVYRGLYKVSLASEDNLGQTVFLKVGSGTCRGP